jgi:two-component system, OmpR family, sensor histidine kinase ArlS
MGRVKKKLLDKTLRAYVIFSVIVVMVSAPAFYLLTKGLVTHEAEEVLFLHKGEFVAGNLPSLKTENILLWNQVSRDTKIEDTPLVSRDSLFQEFFRDTVSDEDVPFRVLLSPISVEGKNRTLMNRVSMIESEALITHVALLFCLVLVILLTGLYVITRRLSQRIWKPFYSSISQLELFELDKGDLPELPATDIEEFDRLNRSTHKLLERSLATYRTQKEFIENAAHELQTPLASLQAKLDVLVQEVTINQNVGTAFSSLHESLAKINRLNKNLLLLSKIENNQFSATEMVSVDTLVKRQVGFMEEQVLEKGVRIQAEVSGPVDVKTNFTLLEVAVGNLLLNALKHNLPGGLILVRLGGNKLTISNSGGASLPVDEKLFKRFSAQASQGGSGLGLAIVKKISDLHGWKVDYAFENGLHVFGIVF